MLDEEKYNISVDSIRFTVLCDICGSEFTRTKKNVKASRKKMILDLCRGCSCRESIHNRPQCGKAYWTTDRKETHSHTMLKSEAYRSSLSTRTVHSGNNNHMFGKSHTSETKDKMSASRKGKTGSNATAWKGGKQSLNRRLKSYIRDWFVSVKQRDNYVCQKCRTSGGVLHSHHIVPFSKIVKELTEGLIGTDDEIFEMIKDDVRITDPDLSNGITLCLSCHRKEHGAGWGSKRQ